MQIMSTYKLYLVYKYVMGDEILLVHLKEPDAKQVKQRNFLNHIKTLVQIGHMVKVELGF